MRRREGQKGTVRHSEREKEKEKERNKERKSDHVITAQLIPLQPLLRLHLSSD